MRPVPHLPARRAWLSGPLLLALAACPPATLDPVVSAGPQASASTGDPSNTSLSASSSDGPITDAPAPTTGTGEPSPSTGADPTVSSGSTDGALDDTSETSASGTTGGRPDDTTGAPDSSSSTAFEGSTSTTDTTGTGTTGADDSTGGALLDPCPIDAPMLVEISGTTPIGPFTAATGVFHWETGPNLYLSMAFLEQIPPVPWDLDLSIVPYLGISITGFDGEAPEFWLGDRSATFWHDNGMDTVDIVDQPIEITVDTLEVWAFEWSDYDVTPLLGGNFSLVGDGWDIGGEFIIPYCHPLSELHPI